MRDVHLLEQTEADVPAENNWLSLREAHRLNNLRFAKRHGDWRLGRWTAKRALATCLNLPHDPRSLTEIEICTAPSGAPEVFLHGHPAPVSISLSHRSGRAVSAVALSTVALGCDLETVEPRSDGFAADYFTAEEQALVARSRAADRPRLLALLWSAKESALKALHAGLRLDTHSVVVKPDRASADAGGWQPLQVRYAGHQTFRGWWRHDENFLWTLVSAPPPNPPIAIQIPARPRGVSPAT